LRTLTQNAKNTIPVSNTKQKSQSVYVHPRKMKDELTYVLIKLTIFCVLKRRAVLTGHGGGQRQKKQLPHRVAASLVTSDPSLLQSGRRRWCLPLFICLLRGLSSAVPKLSLLYVRRTMGWPDARTTVNAKKTLQFNDRT